MKCFVCEKEASFKDFTDVGFCSKTCMNKNYKQDIDVIIDMLVENGMIQEVEHE